jgi:hypothetical protein
LQASFLYALGNLYKIKILAKREARAVNERELFEEKRSGVNALPE